MRVARTIDELRAALRRARRDRARADDGRVPRGARGAVRGRTGRERRRRRLAVRQPGPVRRARRPRRATRATRRATSRSPRARASTCCSRPAADELYPPGFQTWVDVEELGAGARGRRAARALPRRRHDLPQALPPRPAAPRVLRPEGRAAGRRGAADGARPRPRTRARDPRRADRSRPRTGSRSRRATRRLSPEERRAALALPRALATRDPGRARELLATGLEVDYLEVAPFDPPVLAAAVRVGRTRLIDNVPLEGDER